MVYHETKRKGTATEVECEAFARRTASMMKTYPKKMNSNITAAASYLFTFLRYKNMGGTNNLAGGGARHIVVRRKINCQTSSWDGMPGLGILFTCLLGTSGT